MDPEVKKLRQDFDSFMKDAKKRKLAARVEALEKAIKNKADKPQGGKGGKDKKPNPGHGKKNK